MNTCLKLILPVLFISLQQNLHGQATTSHPLSGRTLNARHDSDKVKMYLQYSDEALKTNREKARGYAQSALAICKRRSLTALEAKSLMAFCKAIRYTGDVNELLQYDEKALKLAQASGKPDVLFEAKNTYAYDLLNVSANLTKASDLLNELEKYALESTDDVLKIKYKLTRALHLFKTRKNKDAIAVLKEGLALAKESNQAYLGANCKIRIFQSTIFSGIHDSTVVLAFEALDYFSKNNYHEDAAYCEFLIGESYRLHGNTEKAFSHYEKAYPITVKFKNHLVAGGIQMSYVQTFMTKQQYDLERTAIEKVQHHYRNLNFEPGTGIVTCFLAQYHSSIGEFKKADTLFMEAEAIGEKLNYAPLKTTHMLLKTLHLQNQNKTQQADSLALETLATIEKNVPKGLIDNLYSKNDRFSAEQKRFYLDSTFRKNNGMATLENLRENNRIGDSSIPIYQPLLSSFDSTLSYAFNKQILNVETQYKTRLVADSLRQEQQNALIARQKVRNNKIILLSVGVVSLLLLGGFALEYRSRKRAEKDKEKIQLLQNEIHHRVKNNLGVISRLVDIAGRNAVDDVPLSSLKTRIKSIELLHKHLYNNEAKPGNIALQSYLEDLCLAIAATFETGKDIRINVNAGEELESNIAEKLGLIINELVTNSFKYAFEGKESGSINITAKRSDENNIEVAVKDDGVGFDANKNKSNYGMKLIKGLSHELNGKFSLSGNGGTQFQLNIPA